MMMYPFDSTIILLLPALIFTMWAQFKVKSTFAKYSEVRARRGVTADQVSRELLDRFGLTNVPVQRVAGQLTDHYDPRAKVLRLSDSVSGNPSIAAIGVAAHEVGHAIQDKEGYSFLRFRNAMVPAVNICSSAAMPLFFIGLLMSSLNLLNLGILLFCGVLVFHAVTLPVELDASSRAIKLLRETGLLNAEELKGAKSVLSAAAMTYIAALLTTIMTLVRLLALRNSRRD